MLKIPFSKPDHPTNPKAYLSTLKEIFSKHVAEGETFAHILERKVAEITGTVYASAFNSTPIALKVFLSYIGIQKGDQIVCPSYLPVAYVNAILDMGAIPVFADLKAKQFEMNMASLTVKMNPKTRAVLFAYPYGIPCNAKDVVAFCRRHSVVLLELVLSGLGSKYQSKALGTFGDAGIVEFHPKRSLCVGDGGFLLTDDEALAGYARRWLLSRPIDGNDPSPPKKRISEFYACIGLWLIERMQEAFFRRMQLAKKYDDAFRSLDNLISPMHALKGDWNHDYYPLIIEGERRNRIADFMMRHGIDTYRGYVPCHTNTFIDALIKPPRLPFTESIAESTLLLPMYPSLTPEEQDFIVSVAVEAMAKYRCRTLEVHA